MMSVTRSHVIANFCAMLCYSHFNVFHVDFQRVCSTLFRLPTTDWLQEWLVEGSLFVAVQTSDGNLIVSWVLQWYSGIFNQVFELNITFGFQRFSDRELWRLRNLGKYQQRALDFKELGTSSTASTCIHAPQPFGLEPWLSLWSRP